MTISPSIQKELVEESALGCQFAAISILDDAGERGFGFWHEHAVQMIAGNSEAGQKGLSHVLQERFQLQLDTAFDLKQKTAEDDIKAVDMQGYVAHNDDTVVFAIQCSTSARDNLVNADFLSSEWEPSDADDAYAGRFSEFQGRNSDANDTEPAFRVHTGFYNNFLSLVPIMKQYVEPLLGVGQKPRKVYVVGHSLGGAIATLAGIRLWQEYFALNDNNQPSIPQTLRVVTMGGPRPCERAMAEYLDEQFMKYQQPTVMRNASPALLFCRVRRNQDGVPDLPTSIMGHEHVPQQTVFLTADNQIKFCETDEEASQYANKVGPKDAATTAANTTTLNPKQHLQAKLKGMKDFVDGKIAEKLGGLKKNGAEESTTTTTADEDKYWAQTNAFPGPIRDHCPNLYLLPFRNECPHLFP